MAPSITASLHESGKAVELTIDKDGGDVATVRRLVDGFDSNGEPRYYVRGLWNNSIATTGLDVDFPQNRGIGYIVNVDGTDSAAEYLDDGAGTPPATGDSIDLGADYIIGLGSEASAVPVHVMDPGTLSWASTSQTIKVRGRRDPVVVGDIRQYPSFELPVWTLNETAQSALTTILYQYPVICFSPRYTSWISSVTALYLSVQDYVEEAPRNRLVGVRRFRMQVTQVGAPKIPLCTSVGAGYLASSVRDA